MIFIKTRFIKKRFIKTAINKLVILGALLFSLSVNAEIAVIASADSSLSAADAGELERLYLGKTKSLSGASVKPINQAKGDTLEAFNKTLLNKSSSQIKAYWSKLVFTGKGTPPKEVGSDAEMIAAVKGDASAVGYVDASAVTPDVKVLLKL